MLLDKAVRVRLSRKIGRIRMSKVVDAVCTHELGRQDRLAVFNDFVNVFASPQNACTVGCRNDRQALDAEGVEVGGNANDDVRAWEYSFGPFEKLKVAYVGAS